MVLRIYKVFIDDNPSGGGDGDSWRDLLRRSAWEASGIVFVAPGSPLI